MIVHKKLMPGHANDAVPHSRAPDRTGSMSPERMKDCLALLRQADALLEDGNEVALGCHLSLVIERLAEKLDRT
jgi:hypothetical protein